MRIAFLIGRKNYYRVLGPVVEEALRRGYQVECWHDWSHPRRGKGYEFPDTVPAFPSGSPVVRAYYGGSDLAKQFGADLGGAVVCLDAPDPTVKAGTKAKWLYLQYSAEIILQQTPRGVLDADAVAMYSSYWVDQLEARFATFGLGDEIRRKSVTVGVPEMDVVHHIDPEEVRRRLRLPSDRPLVLYLPFPLRSNPQTFWLRHVYAPSTRVRQALRTLLAGRLEYWPHVTNRWNDRRLVQELRAFCDRNGAVLVMKSRLKDPIPGYARRVAARTLYDLSHYPPTILELLSVASLCVHAYSTAAFEAAYCKVPSLCLAPDAKDMGIPGLVSDFVHNGKRGGIYNWPGIAYWRPLVEAFDGLRQWSLADFPLDPRARSDYVERFLGFDDGRSSARLLDLAAQLVESGSYARI